MRKSKFIQGNMGMAAVFAGLIITLVNSFPVNAQPVVTEEATSYENTEMRIVESFQISESSNREVSTLITAIGPGIPQTQAAAEAPPESQEGIGEQVVSFASQFIGNPYVYGGTSLTNGADCSGFVMSVFRQFGISLPRTSREQGRSGIDVAGLENARPGDVVFYEGHIGIYMGQNQLVHSSNPEDGIKVSPVTYKPILSIRRFL